MKPSLRILAVSARSERIGYVVVEDGELLFWEGTTAAKDARTAGAYLFSWMQTFRPDIMVSENPETPGRKGSKQIAILRAFAEVADREAPVNLLVRRQKPHANLYEEAKQLAHYFPDIMELVPNKPPIYRKEPYRLIFFEALSLIRDADLIPHEPTEAAIAY